MRKEKHTLLLSEALNLFLTQKEIEGRTPDTLAFYKGKIGAFITYAGDIPVTSFTSELATEYILATSKRKKYDLDHPRHKVGDTTVKRSTVKNYVLALKIFSKFLYEEGYLKTNPLARIKLPKEDKEAIDILTDEEIGNIYSCINPRTANGAKLFLIVTLLLDTGIRAGELADIEIDDIDFKQARIKVIGKGRKERFVPFGMTTSKALLSYINSYRPDSVSTKLLVDRNGAQLNRTTISQTIRRLGQRAGVSKLHTHLFRHTFGTNWIKNGGDVFALQTILGHYDLSVTKIYISLAQRDLQVKHRMVSPVDRLNVGRKTASKQKA